MSHNTMVDGTVYEISGGRTLVNGTGYSIDKGRTLVGGTAYEVGFAPTEATVTIKADGVGVGMGCYLTIDGVKYGTALSTDSYVFPVGTVISCYAKTDSDDMSGANPDYGYHSKYGNIMVNGEYVAWATHGDYDATYDYIVTENAYIELKNSKGLGRVRITEIPEGHALVQINAPRYTSENPCSVTINGITYTNIRPNKGTLATLIVPVGTEIHCVAYWGDYANGGYIYVNDTQVAKYNAPPYDYNNTKAEYTYVVTGNVDIQLETKDYSKEYYGGNIYITEL